MAVMRWFGGVTASVVTGVLSFVAPLLVLFFFAQGSFGLAGATALLTPVVWGAFWALWVAND